MIYVYIMLNTQRTVFLLGLILVASLIGKTYEKYIDNREVEENDLIKKYLLNEPEVLKGRRRPKLWIHTIYEINARKWKSFGSRTSTDLNQSYITMTIQTIVDKCSESFDICLIDDESFSKLIPSWDVHVSTLADPIKSQMRELGLAQILYLYGGILVPNSFLCVRNLQELYERGMEAGKPFICENINRGVHSNTGTTNIYSQAKIQTFDTLVYEHDVLEIQRNQWDRMSKERWNQRFMPFPKFMGAGKNDPVIKEMVEFLKRRNQFPHLTNEPAILGEYSQWCLSQIMDGKMTLVGGELIGIKGYSTKKPILLDQIMEECPSNTVSKKSLEQCIRKKLDLHPNIFGIYIPEDEILSRNKYQWFAYLSQEDVLKTNACIVPFF